MSESAKYTQLSFKLWLSCVLGSLILFVVVKLIWEDANIALILIFLVAAFAISLMISIIQKRKRDK
ncbi:hypothetical protein [Sutcliffiella horikoshii]|uniref:hypothetical protein n=1 Tax=Sutcliffiella horikoshii TaxID=79883 RepID=UPI00384C8F51